MKKLLPILVAVILACLLGRVYFNSGFPFTHDGENHLARFANYKVAVKERQIPPRFAPNLMNHYGYPVFNYNYPLANILSLPFSILKINYEVTFKIIALVSMIIGIFSGLWWLKLKNNSFLAQVTSLITLTTSPYLVNVVWFRGNIGELLALMLALVLLLDLERNLKIKNKFYDFLFSVVIWGSFFLSHNISVLLITPLLALYWIVSWWPSYKKIAFYGIRILLGVGLSLWFWIPALLEKSSIILDNSNINLQFSHHFPTLSQLISSPLSFGFSLKGSIDSISFSLGVPTIVTLLLLSGTFLALILQKKLTIKNTNDNKTILFFSAVTFAILILMIPISNLIWQTISFFQFIQFPWRLEIILAVSTLPLVAFIYSKNKSFKIVLWLAVVVQVVFIFRIKAVDYFHRAVIDYDAFSQSTSTKNENLPKGFTYTDIADWQPGPVILSGSGNISVNKWSGSHHQYSLSLDSDSVIVEPTMKFLGWETEISSPGVQQKINYLDNEVIAGRIGYELPAGEYNVETTFTQNTFARKIGNGVSLLSFILTIIGVVYFFIIQIKYDKTRN